MTAGVLLLALSTATAPAPEPPATAASPAEPAAAASAPASASPPTPALAPIRLKHAIAIGTLAGDGVGTRLATAWHDAIAGALAADGRLALTPSPADAVAHGRSAEDAMHNAAQLVVRARLEPAPAGERGVARLVTELTDAVSDEVLAVSQQELTAGRAAPAVARTATAAVAAFAAALDDIPWTATVVSVTRRRTYLNRGAREGLAVGALLAAVDDQGGERARAVVADVRDRIAIITFISGDATAIVAGARLRYIGRQAAAE